MKPLVSICIPNYNSEKYIKSTIESALNQTYKNIEIIIIDNNSTDKSWAIVKSFRKKGIIAIKNKKNIGPTSNYNKCIRASKGKYIKILHSDDLLEKYCIEKQVEIMEKNENIGFVHGKTFIIDEDGKIIDRISWKENDDVSSGEEKLSTLLCGNYIMFPSVMMRKKSLDKIGFFDTKLYYCCDWNLWMRFCLKYDIAYLNDPIAYYRSHKESSSYLFEKKKVSGYYQINCLNSIFSKLNYKKLIKKKKYFYFRLAIEQIAKGLHLNIKGNRNLAKKNLEISILFCNNFAFKSIVHILYILIYFGKYPSLIALRFGKIVTRLLT